jgi:predicted dithiol-disulfide oxidoreductase (DUF899 family)
MPWVAVDNAYAFEGPQGRVSLQDLFEGRRQLIVYRAFFEPGVFGWPEHACRGCSLGADQVSHLAHLNARDTTLAYASRAPQADIARLKARMGWDMPWYTITDSFDADFGVDEWHGHNVFFRDGDKVFRTYFINSRGDEAMGTTWSYLDITPLGRQETWEDSPEGYPQTPPYKWWNWHDNYDAEASPDPKWVEVSDAGEAAFRLPRGGASSPFGLQLRLGRQRGGAAGLYSGRDRPARRAARGNAPTPNPHRPSQCRAMRRPCGRLGPLPRPAGGSCSRTRPRPRPLAWPHWQLTWLVRFAPLAIRRVPSCSLITLMIKARPTARLPEPAP